MVCLVGSLKRTSRAEIKAQKLSSPTILKACWSQIIQQSKSPMSRLSFFHHGCHNIQHFAKPMLIIDTDRILFCDGTQNDA